jgi:hypothetical protein
VVNEGQPIDFVAKLAELRAKKGGEPPAVPQPPEQLWDQKDLLPDLGGNLSDAEKELDTFVANIDILDAYRRWCGKMTPDAGGKRESIMISCPDPSHPDKDPSAWINLDKQTYFCGGCQVGGDIHDIAAMNMGYPVPGYKDGETFHKLRLQMAETFGFRMKQVPGGKVTWIEPPPGSPPPPPVNTPVPESVQEKLPEESDDNLADVSHMWAEDDGEDDLVIYPTVDWKNLIPEDTFIYEYMRAATNDDAPEEYHFWHSLLALGLVVGRNVTLDDTQPVYANLMLCILGATGTGKSRSRRHLNQVLKETAPYTEDGTRTNGVKIIPVPSSGEYLVSQFAYEGRDPTNNKVSLGMQPVTGIVDFDEMSALLARANRQGSTMKPTIMQFADATADVKIGGLQRGDFIAERPFCTITASTQPKAIRMLLSRNDTGSGFLNRWVFAGGKQKQIEVIGGNRSSIKVDLARAVEELKKVRGWGALERSIEMEDDAYALYSKFFRERIEPAKVKDDTDLLKRIDLITKKLMLILTINLRKEKVPVQVVEAVMELFDYVLECYGILNSNIGVTLMQDVMTEIQRHIHRHMQKTGRGASARDISRYTARRNYSLEQIKKALDVMTSLDIIELEPKGQGSHMGRPTMRYRVVGE